MNKRNAMFQGSYIYTGIMPVWTDDGRKILPNTRISKKVAEELEGRGLGKYVKKYGGK